MTTQRFILFGIAWLVLCSGSPSAYGWHGSTCLAGPTAWWLASRTYTQEHIPYFAKHPPVYYSRPIARPYGYYPYAYSPAMHTPQVALVRPAVVRNPHVAVGMAPSESGSAASKPKRIVNPFAEETATVFTESPLAEP